MAVWLQVKVCGLGLGQQPVVCTPAVFVILLQCVACGTIYYAFALATIEQLNFHFYYFETVTVLVV